MQRTLVTLFVAIALAAGCKSEAEKQLATINDKQKEMISALKGVTDVPSAKAADVRIKQISRDLSATFEKMKATKATPDEQKRLLEKFKGEMEQSRKDMEAEMTRIEKIPGAQQELFDGLMEFAGSAMKAQMAK